MEYFNLYKTIGFIRNATSVSAQKTQNAFYTELKELLQETWYVTSGCVS